MFGVTNNYSYLPATAQSQLTQLKAANNVPLSRIQSNISEVKSKGSSIDSIQKAMDNLQDAIKTLRDPTLTPEARTAAMKDLAADFNAVQSYLKNANAKGAKLQGMSEIRSAPNTLRRDFADAAVQADLKAAGMSSSAEGLKVTSATPGVLSAATLDKLEATITAIDERISGAKGRLDSQVDRLNSQMERVKRQVDAANSRTEKNYMKYYQAMQSMNSASGAASSSFWA